MKKALFLSAVLFISGCGTFGSQMLPNNSISFNQAAVTTKDEQMLLNIVRLRYSDRPLFMKVNSISSQMAMQSTFGMNIAHFKQSTGFSQFGLSYLPNIQFSERPTVTYTPLQGQKFTKQMLEPLDITDIYSLIRSGWSVSRVLRLTTQEIGHLHNAEGANRSVSSYIPHYKNFMKFSYELRKLHAKHLVEFRLEKYKGQHVIDIAFKKTIPASMAKVLGVKRGSRLIRLSRGRNFSRRNGLVHVEARSFSGIMHYLSKSVALYPPHKKRKWLDTTHYANGQEFDWRNITRYIMKVDYAQHRPTNANVATFYRGIWFFIDDADSSSKETLSLLAQIFALKADDRSGHGPVLTLPL